MEYVDFTKSSFDDGVGRLSTHLGPPEESRRTTSTNSFLRSSTRPAGTRRRRHQLADSRDSSPVRWPQWQPSSGSGSHCGRRRRGRSRTRPRISSRSGPTQRRRPRLRGEAASDRPVANQPDELVTLYGRTRRPRHGCSRCRPYIDEATQEGALWRLTGAAFAVDYDPEPEPQDARDLLRLDGRPRSRERQRGDGVRRSEFFRRRGDSRAKQFADHLAETTVPATPGVRQPSVASRPTE